MEGHFNLRKWNANSAQLTDLSYSGNKELHATDSNTPEKVLGLALNSKTDTLIYDFSDK